MMKPDLKTPKFDTVMSTASLLYSIVRNATYEVESDRQERFKQIEAAILRRG